MQVVEFTVPLYEADIVYLIGETATEMIEYINKKHKDNTPVSWDDKFEWGEDANTTNGYQFHINAPMGDGETFYVWISESTSSLLFHETFHLVGDILFTRGIRYTNESEEAFAYLGGWIFMELYKQIKDSIVY